MLQQGKLCFKFSTPFENDFNKHYYSYLENMNNYLVCMNYSLSSQIDFIQILVYIPDNYLDSSVKCWLDRLKFAQVRLCSSFPHNRFVDYSYT